jgi:hypothetical protein
VGRVRTSGCWITGVLSGVMGWPLLPALGFGSVVLGNTVGLPVGMVGNVLAGCAGADNTSGEDGTASGFRGVRMTGADCGAETSGVETLGVFDGMACGPVTGVVRVRAGCAGGAFIARALGGVGRVLAGVLTALPWPTIPGDICGGLPLGADGA